MTQTGLSDTSADVDDNQYDYAIRNFSKFHKGGGNLVRITNASIGYSQ